jgi:hypothetical protein
MATGFRSRIGEVPRRVVREIVEPAGHVDWCAPTHSSALEKSCGSSALTAPNRFGDGVSVYGSGCDASPIDMFVYISGQ